MTMRLGRRSAARAKSARSRSVVAMGKRRERNMGRFGFGGTDCSTTAAGFTEKISCEGRPAQNTDCPSHKPPEPINRKERRERKAALSDFFSQLLCALCVLCG